MVRIRFTTGAYKGRIKDFKDYFILEIVKRLSRCHEKVWLGLGIPHPHSYWKWLGTRTALTFSKWAPGWGAYEPRNWKADKYCGFMWLNGGNASFWVHGACKNQKGVLSTVCQFDADVRRSRRTVVWWRESFGLSLGGGGLD